MVVQLDEPKEIYFPGNGEEEVGRKMGTIREIRGMEIERGSLRKLSEVQKRNKLKTGKCVEKVTRIYIWTIIRLI